MMFHRLVSNDYAKISEYGRYGHHSPAKACYFPLLEGGFYDGDPFCATCAEWHYSTKSEKGKIPQYINEVLSGEYRFSVGSGPRLPDAPTNRWSDVVVTPTNLITKPQ